MKRHILLLALILGGMITKAQLAGYSYIKSIAVSNSSTTTATGYQLRLTINTQSLISSSQMLASGADLRFGKTCNGSSLYNYWIESGLNTASTVIWVKLDTLPANRTKTFFMFYGNSSASGLSDLSTVFVGPNSSTDSVSSGAPGGVGNSQRGFRFSPNEDLLVTAFGKREPTGTTRYITLFDNATQTIVAQMQVAGAAAQYSYTNLPNVFWITQGTQYILEMYQNVADGYYFGTSSQIGQHLTYIDMRYCNGCNQNTFPVNYLTNIHYGVPDFWYWTKTTVSPAPTYTLGLGPNVQIAQTSASVCPLTAVSLTASSSMPSTSFTWQPGNLTGAVISVTPSGSTTYSLFGSSAGCSYSVSSTATVVLNAVPAITITGNAPICGTGTDILTASGASTYTWATSEHTSTLTVSPGLTTHYTVTGTSALGCTNTAVTTVTVNSLPVVSITGGNLAICSGSSAALSASGAATYSWSTAQTATNISVSPSANSSYSVVGTSIAGCTNSAITSITVNTTPTVSIAVGNPTLCSGSTTSLTASGASSYSWNTTALTASISVSPGTTSNYSVIGTSVEGCTNSANANVTVYITPTLSITVASPSICSGYSVDLSASGASAYLWNTSSATSSISVSPPTTTAYSIVGTSAQGCTNSAVTTITVYITPTVAISGGNLTICSGSVVNLTATGAPAFLWNTSDVTSTISVTPSVTANYTVVGASVEGCTNMAVTNISVNITPTVIIGSFSPSICSGNPISLVASGASTYSWSTGVTTSSITETPLATTAYTVDGFSPEGCVSTAIATVTVFTTPTISISGGPSVTCAGEPLSITASGAATYSWNTGANTATLVQNPTMNTTYTVTGFSSDGCLGIASISQSVNPLPVINASTSSTICIGETATLTATGADTYSWSTTETSTLIMVSPTSTTVYSVTGTNSVSGCDASATVSQNVSLCTSLSKIEATGFEFSLYPNPNEGKFTVQAEVEALLVITDLLGQTIYFQKHSAGRSEINVNEFQNGVYFLLLEVNGKIYQQKFIKE